MVDSTDQDQTITSILNSYVQEDDMDKFSDNMWDQMDSLGNLLLDKHADYGPYNVAKAPGGPLNGLRVRIWDKVARINNLLDNSRDPRNESVRDSFVDLANYAVIALMVIDGTWPGTEE